PLISSTPSRVYTVYIYELKNTVFAINSSEIGQLAGSYQTFTFAYITNNTEAVLTETISAAILKLKVANNAVSLCIAVFLAT
ncbi:hypothetical protein, partial [Alkalimonas sp.]|uniref:hypothetical protein n=1 Tax=Alkalimonas sp. TaxID=1872453 RepID=UPI00263B3F90